MLPLKREPEMASSKTVRGAKPKLPWWLEEGTEICPAYSHAYVYQTE